MAKTNQLQRKREEYRKLDKRDRRRYWTDGILNNALYILMVIFIVYTAIKNKNFVSAGSIANIPAKHYKRSARQMPAVLREPEYAAGKTLRKVNCKGYISVRQRRYYLSETFIGNYLELLPLDENVVAVCYGDFIVAKIDLDQQMFLSRRISRR